MATSQINREYLEAQREENNIRVFISQQDREYRRFLIQENKQLIVQIHNNLEVSHYLKAHGDS